MPLHGARELRARLHALDRTPRVVGEKWATRTVRLAQAAVPVRTGELRRSIRVGSVSSQGAIVTASPVAAYIDRGTRAHDITPVRARVLAFDDDGPRFAKRVRHPRVAPRPFRDRVARQALSQTDMAQVMVDQWDGAA